MRRFNYIFGSALVFAGRTFGETVYLPPVADTTLSEYFPSNNLGGLQTFNCGTTERGTYNRALLRFDLAAAIPPGAKINRADLAIEVVNVSQNGDPGFPDFGLYRLLVPWGEGNKVSPTNCNACTGQGNLATTNEATWLSPFAFTTNIWSAPGGAATNDFFPTPSSVTTLYGVDGYSFASTPRSVADAQMWLDQPATNFGWMMICHAESQLYSARRIASREDPGNTPTLRVDYIPFRIDNPAVASNRFQFSFLAITGQTYAVQFYDEVNPGVWQVLTQFAAPPALTTYSVTDSLSNTQRFYRLVTP